MKKLPTLERYICYPKLYDVPGRPVIFNCGTLSEKASEFLDNQLKPVMQKGMSCIKN